MPPCEAPERELDPLVRAALHRERAADLGHHEHVRRDEDDGEHDEPEEALRRRSTRPCRACRARRTRRSVKNTMSKRRSDLMSLLFSSLRERRRVECGERRVVAIS